MCADGLGYVYVCEGYVVLDQCDEPPPCLGSLSVRMAVYFCYFSFLCEFCFLYCDDVRLGALYEVFSSLILFLMPFMLI